MSKQKQAKFTLGEQPGCYLDDKIHMELSPRLLQKMITILQVRALSAEDYISQGVDRGDKDYLQAVLDEYNEAREAKDKEDKWTK